MSEQRRECEEGLAIAALGNPELAIELSTVVGRDDFQDQFCGSIVALVAELQIAGQFSQQRIRSELRGRGYLETTSELSSLIKFSAETVLDHSARYFAEKLARFVLVDSARAELRKTESKLLGEEDPKQVLDNLVASIEAMRARESKLWESVPVVAERVYLEHKKRLSDGGAGCFGNSTGYPSLDDVTGGFFRGQLWMIAARSYMGKSTVALSIASRQAERGNGVYFASYEMENEELMDRLFADKTGVHLRKFTQGSLDSDELQRCLVASQEFDSSFYYFDDRPPNTVAGLKARIKLASQSKHIDLVVVDHLLMFPSDKKMPRHEQLVEISREFKQLAKECDTTVVLLNQLNADAEGAEPSVKHLSQSKGIIQNLDCLILLHRESNTSEYMKCKVPKNRKGPPGEINMRFLGEIQRFEELSVEDSSNYEPAFAM